MSRNQFGRLLRRYRPVVLAVIAILAVIQLVPPLQVQEATALRVEPFGSDALPGPASVPTPGGAGEVLSPEFGGNGIGVVPGGTPPVDGLPPASIGIPSDDGGPPTLLTALPSRGAGGVVVAGDGSIVATLADRNGEAGLAILDPAGGLVRTVTLPGLSGLADVALRDSRTAVVLSTTPSAVTTVALDTGQVTGRTPIPDVPPCMAIVRETNCDATTSDQAPRPKAIGITPAGDAYVADAGQGAIWRIRQGTTTAEQWLVDSAFAAGQGAAGPTGLAIDGAGNLVIALPRSLATDNGSVYVLAVGDDGWPAARRRLAILGAGAHPAGLVLGITGSIYLPIPDLGFVLVLSNEGGELRRIAIAPKLGAGRLGSAVFRDRSLLVAGVDGIATVPVGELGGRAGGAT